MQKICKDWHVTEAEYLMLEERFGKLVEYEAWQLINRNTRSNHLLDQEDFSQDIRMAMIRAGSYFKRQTYIEKCISLCRKHVKDKFVLSLVDCLATLWKNKTRHGANRQKFGPHQEKLLEKILRKYVPRSCRPNRHAPLHINSKFRNYCKSITWNEQKAQGRKITREKPLRAGAVSLSEFEYASIY